MVSEYMGRLSRVVRQKSFKQYVLKSRTKPVSVKDRHPLNETFTKFPKYEMFIYIYMPRKISIDV